MQKVAIKAFLCSFSISMLAFTAANRAFLHEKNETPPSIDLKGKNIALFVKNLQTYRHPVKKIDLNLLDNTTPQADSIELADNFDDIIKADEGEYITIPLKNEAPIALADIDTDVLKTAEIPSSDEKNEEVVYSLNQPIAPPKIEQKAIYTPQMEIKTDLAESPKAEDVSKPVVYASNSEVLPQKDISAPPPANTQKNAPLPLVYEKTRNHKQIAIGNPEEMNHVALAQEKAPIESMAKKIEDTLPEKEKKQWKSLDDNPWVIARANGVNRNLLADKDLPQTANQDAADVLNIQQDKAGVKVATETVKNLIIPLPEKLADDEKLMPKLAYPSSSEDAKKEKIMNAKSLREEAKKEQEQKKLLTEIEDEDLEMTVIPLEQDDEQSEKQPEKEEKKGLISSLNKMFSSAVKETKDTAKEVSDKVKRKLSARSAIRRAAKANRPINIIPQEIKMSFQPNKAEISGQTLRWVQAFASKAAQEESTFLEVRIDGTRPSVLQQRRLNMLYNILTNKGVEYSKINVVFTSREPNSFILRMVNSNSKEQNNAERINNLGNNHIQW